MRKAVTGGEYAVTCERESVWNGHQVWQHGPMDLRAARKYERSIRGLWPDCVVDITAWNERPDITNLPDSDSDSDPDSGPQDDIHDRDTSSCEPPQCEEDAA